MKSTQVKQRQLVATFAPGTDSSLANALNHVLQSDERTQLVGFSVSHPTEHIMKMQLYTKTDDPNVVFCEGVERLIHQCESVLSSFERELSSFS